MGLAVVRSLEAPRRLSGTTQLEEFEQELVDQYLLAAVASGYSDSTVGGDRSVVFEFARFMGRPVWTATTGDADRFLAWQRRTLGRAPSTVQEKAWTLAQFFDFLVRRYQGDIHAVTGCVVEQVIDEFNRPVKVAYGTPRVPPSAPEVEALFRSWREWVHTDARKFLPAARDYLAASLWRRAGLRIQETYMLDIRDWRRDLGVHGAVHVRFGKGSRGRGPKTRLVPAINQVGELLDWWMVEVRHQFGDDWADPDAPLLPSERHDPHTGCCARVQDQALRDGLAAAVGRWLPAWAGRCTPHTLRHFCASSLYAQGMDLKAIQELLGHEWLSTTTAYIHVQAEHVERAWAAANRRVSARLIQGQG